jgi:hypothetical protein
MPTQPEIDDVLTKVATYQTARVAANAAETSANLATSLAVAARTHWETAIANGENDEEKLTALLLDLFATETESATKQETAQTIGQTAGTANSAINNTIYTLLHPEP